MSLILDALKKADAERHANQTSGVLQATPTQQVAAPLPISYPQPHRSRLKAFSFAALALILAAAAWKAGGSKLIETLTPVATPFQSTSPVQPSVASVISAAPPAVVPSPIVPPQTPEIVVASEVPVPPPIPEAAPPTPSKPAPIKSTISSGTSSATGTPASGVAKPQLPEPQAMMLAQLPQHIQGEISPLAISGSIYSSDPKDRMLLVGKQMVREGQEVAPGLILQQILPKSALLQYKGYVFKVNN